MKQTKKTVKKVSWLKTAVNSIKPSSIVAGLINIWWMLLETNNRGHKHAASQSDWENSLGPPPTPPNQQVLLPEGSWWPKKKPEKKERWWLNHPLP